ncbi:MAG TPA: methylamine utilization protein [Rhodocyclaceae bacterium]|nr:methylamine utilization protein [Rhodocyclaceae bacterium]
MAGKITAAVKDQAGRPVEDAVISALPLDARKIPPPQKTQDEVDQIDKDFVPHVKVVYVNTLVHFPNKDNIRHHVYSFSVAKKFELPLYAGTQSAPVLFDKAGVVVLGCNIHDWMLGYVYVTDTPYFGKTKNDGIAGIDNLPAGDYLLRVWQPRMEDSEESTGRKVTLNTDEGKALEWQLTLKPDKRISRTSSSRGGAYR